MNAGKCKMMRVELCVWDVMIRVARLKQVQSFKYLGCLVKENETDCDEI